MTITTLSGVCCFDAEQCYCNIAGYVEAVLSPFARSPLHGVPFITIRLRVCLTFSARHSGSTQSPMSGAARLPVFPDTPYYVKNGDLWLCVMRMATRERTSSGAFRLEDRGNPVGNGCSCVTQVRFGDHLGEKLISRVRVGWVRVWLFIWPFQVL